jgi:hypothetical protein
MLMRINSINPTTRIAGQWYVFERDGEGIDKAACSAGLSLQLRMVSVA